MKRKRHINLKWLYTSALLLVFGLTANAQVTVDARIDSLEMLIGEQAHIKLDVSMDAKSKLRLPARKDTLVNGVEIVDVSQPDTQRLNDGTRLLISQTYTITAFEDSTYYLPPFEVDVDGKIYRSKNLALKVLTLDVDTLHADQFFGPKNVMHPSFSRADWKGIVWMSVLMLVLIGAAIYLYTRFRNNKPIIRHIKLTPKLPPHQKAMQEIAQIKADKAWAQENSKEYYTKLTDTLRTYIQERYGFNAMEMTSNEIIGKLTAVQDKQGLSELNSLFQTADLVKFAKHNTLINENDANLVNAIEFINQTKTEENPNANPAPVELTVEEKRSRMVKYTLAASVAVLALLAVGALAWIVWRIYWLTI